MAMNVGPQSNKIARMVCSIEILEMLFTLNPLLVSAKITNAPKDLEVLWVESAGKMIWVYMASEAFLEVAPGQTIPAIMPFVFSSDADAQLPPIEYLRVCP